MLATASFGLSAATVPGNCIIKANPSPHRTGRKITGTLALATLASGFAAPAKADPPVGLPVFCFRFTDVKEVNPNRFQFEFEILNWTGANANRLRMEFTSSGEKLPNGQPLNNGVTLVDAFIDTNGRPLPGNTHGPIPGNVTPTNNDWTAETIQTETITVGRNPNDLKINAAAIGGDPTDGGTYQLNIAKAIYNAGTPIPYINLPWIQANTGSPQNAISYINASLPSIYGSGYFPNQDFNPLEDMETVDNGTNVLDGFVFEVDSFDPGDYLVYQWFLEPDQFSPGGNGLGVLSRQYPVDVQLSSPVGGFGSLGFTSSNPLLFAPGSPPVGSQFGIQGTLGAGVGFGNISGVNYVPGPVPILAAFSAFGYSRKIRRRLAQAGKRVQQPIETA